MFVVIYGYFPLTHFLSHITGFKHFRLLNHYLHQANISNPS